MAEQLNYIEDPEWLGRYNDAPPNFREITEEQLARETNFGHYAPTLMTNKQIIGFDGPTQPVLSVRLFVYHDGTGVAVSTDYWGKGYYSKPKPVGPLQHIRWFAFEQCKHEMEHTKGLGNCYNEYTCKKCKYVQCIDSSD